MRYLLSLPVTTCHYLKTGGNDSQNPDRDSISELVTTCHYLNPGKTILEEKIGQGDREDNDRESLHKNSTKVVTVVTGSQNLYGESIIDCHYLKNEVVTGSDGSDKCAQVGIVSDSDSCPSLISDVPYLENGGRDGGVPIDCLGRALTVGSIVTVANLSAFSEKFASRLKTPAQKLEVTNQCRIKAIRGSECLLTIGGRNFWVDSHWLYALEAPTAR